MPSISRAKVGRLDAWLTELSHFPWKNTALTLRERFREDKLGLTASSLTFTTTLALVPFFTAALAVFTAFPMFAQVQVALERWLVRSLIPGTIARQVLGYLTQFAAKASKLGSVGLAFTLVTALALILTIDHTLNGIWRVRRPRPLAQRVLIYWAGLTLGPLLLGASVFGISYAASVPHGLAGAPPGVRLLFDLLEFVLLGAGMTALYRYVPNTPVRWSHALAGGLVVAIGLEIGKKLLGWYLGMVPTYSAIYGAFATVPILLVWIYVAWVIVLLGAVIAAYLPSLLAGVARRGDSPGWNFQLAIETLQLLYTAHAMPAKGMSLEDIARRLRVDTLQLEPAIEALCALDHIGLLDETVSGDPARARYVLLADLTTTSLEPLLHQLLLARTAALEDLWKNSRWPALRLGDVLQKK